MIWFGHLLVDHMQSVQEQVSIVVSFPLPLTIKSLLEPPELLYITPNDVLVAYTSVMPR